MTKGGEDLHTAVYVCALKHHAVFKAHLKKENPNLFQAKVFQNWILEVALDEISSNLDLMPTAVILQNLTLACCF